MDSILSLLYSSSSLALLPDCLPSCHIYGNLRSNTTERQWIIRDYEKLYSKLDHLEEMDKFPETYNPPKLKQEEIENLNGPITGNKIE